MSSMTKQLVTQIKEDLLKEQRNNNHSLGQDRDERILDMLNRLSEFEIDMNILTETYIGATVNVFKKKGKYSNDITIKARELVAKWKGVWDEANKNMETAPLQEDVSEVKVEDSNTSKNNNNIEGNFKSDDNDNNRDASNEDGMSDSDQRQHTQTVCDICLKPADFRDHIGKLQRCKDCGICVHELCYCMVPTMSIDPNFTCHACKAVDTYVEVNNVPSRIGGTGDDMGKKKERMTVEERPMECILCLHKSKKHAMHPVYDACGKEGRQLVLKATKAGIGGKPRRLAWVHTFCAQMLTIQKGYLYGIDKDGDWHGSTNKDDSDEDVEDSENGNDSDSSEEVGGQKYRIGTTIYKKFGERVFTGKVTRFDPKVKYYRVTYEDGDEEEMTESKIKKYLQKPTVLTNQKPQEPVSVSTKAFCINPDMSDEIKEARKLKCFVCDKDDTRSLRIPTQCNVGDNGLHAELQQYIDHVPDVCTRAMHIGCARWTKKYATKIRMAYFYPGQFTKYPDPVSAYPDPVSACFCREHAKIVQEKLSSVNEKSG